MRTIWLSLGVLLLCTKCGTLLDFDPPDPKGPSRVDGGRQDGGDHPEDAALGDSSRDAGATLLDAFPADAIVSDAASERKELDAEHLDVRVDVITYTVDAAHDATRSDDGPPDGPDQLDATVPCVTVPTPPSGVGAPALPSPPEPVACGLWYRAGGSVVAGTGNLGTCCFSPGVFSTTFLLSQAACVTFVGGVQTADATAATGRTVLLGDYSINIPSREERTLTRFDVDGSIRISGDGTFGLLDSSVAANGSAAAITATGNAGLVVDRSVVIGGHRGRYSTAVLHDSLGALRIEQSTLRGAASECSVARSGIACQARGLVVGDPDTSDPRAALVYVSRSILEGGAGDDTAVGIRVGATDVDVSVLESWVVGTTTGAPRSAFGIHSSSPLPVGAPPGACRSTLPVSVTVVDGFVGGGAVGASPILRTAIDVDSEAESLSVSGTRVLGCFDYAGEGLCSGIVCGAKTCSTARSATARTEVRAAPACAEGPDRRTPLWFPCAQDPEIAGTDVYSSEGAMIATGSGTGPLRIVESRLWASGPGSVVVAGTRVLEVVHSTIVGAEVPAIFTTDAPARLSHVTFKIFGFARTTIFVGASDFTVTDSLFDVTPWVSLRNRFATLPTGAFLNNASAGDDLAALGHVDRELVPAVTGCATTADGHLACLPGPTSNPCVDAVMSIGVASDVDGELRSGAFDIGADELFGCP